MHKTVNYINNIGLLPRPSPILKEANLCEIRQTNAYTIDNPNQSVGLNYLTFIFLVELACPFECLL